MAKNSGVFDCWAEYGRPRFGPDVDLLVRLTTWDDAAVQRFHANSPEQSGIEPSFTATTFSDFIAFVFEGWRDRVFIPAASVPREQAAVP